MGQARAGIYREGSSGIPLVHNVIRKYCGAVVGVLINVGMYIERYIIIPVGVTITRMPFVWRQYYPRIEIPMTIGTFALFLLLYMLASRLIPLVPVWEVQE